MDNNIPKIIHFCWFGNGKIPKKDRKCIASWKKYCPDYKIVCWSEKNYDINKNKYMKQAYDSKKWGFVPDYARLDIIYRYGGIYLDTDVELLKSLDPLLKEECFMGCEYGNYVALGLGFGAKKGNRHIKKMRDEYDGFSFINEDGSLNLVASPVISTEYLKKIGFEDKDELQKVDGISIYPTEYFCPQDYEKGLLKCTNNTYSIHRYNASWLNTYDRISHKIQNKIYQSMPFKMADICWKVVNKILRLGKRGSTAIRMLKQGRITDIIKILLGVK